MASFLVNIEQVKKKLSSVLNTFENTIENGAFTNAQFSKIISNT